MNEPEIQTMIVDDQEDIRMLMRLIITSANHGLSVAAEAVNGDDALAQLETVDPTVILLDQMMPHMDGLECAAKIRERRPDQKIVLFSAYLDDDVRRRAREAGVTSVVSKLSMADLPDLIRSAVNT